MLLNLDLWCYIMNNGLPIDLELPFDLVKEPALTANLALRLMMSNSDTSSVCLTAYENKSSSVVEDCIDVVED